jgi:hypothetical protein
MARGAKELLLGARALIAAGWSQFADARGADGLSTEPWSDDAVSWSLLGALVRMVEQEAARSGEYVAVSDLAIACVMLANVVDADSLENWNDAAERTQADILEALELAATEDDSQPEDDYRTSRN